MGVVLAKLLIDINTFFFKEEIEVQGPLKLVPKFKILKTNKKNKHRTSA